MSDPFTTLARCWRDLLAALDTATAEHPTRAAGSAAWMAGRLSERASQIQRPAEHVPNWRATTPPPRQVTAAGAKRCREALAAARPTTNQEDT